VKSDCRASERNEKVYFFIPDRVPLKLHLALPKLREGEGGGAASDDIKVPLFLNS